MSMAARYSFRRWRLLASVVALAAALAACNSADVPRGGPTLPSNPSILSSSHGGTPAAGASAPGAPALVGQPGRANLFETGPRLLRVLP
ncbi:MAG TPA: hypothetical protein VMV93_10265 [Chloroflexota bacterium]|nr:hypothetical protein [Chloroflexota bacterium]